MTTPEEYKDLTEAIKQLQEEIARLQTTMIAAAEEIQEHWKAHCDEDGYGPANLMHRLEKGVSSGYPGYNAGQFTKMEEENRILKSSMKTLLLAWQRGDSYDFYEDLIERHKLIEP